MYASVLLDGASGNLGGQDIVNIPHDQVRSGLRVKAVWKPKNERSAEGVSNRGWGGVASAIDAFEPSGEPDMPQQYEEHVSSHVASDREAGIRPNSEPRPERPGAKHQERMKWLDRHCDCRCRADEVAAARARQ